MSKEEARRAKRIGEDKAKKARKTQEKAEKDEKGRAKEARKVQDKADRVEKDKVEGARKVQDRADQAERAEGFQKVLSGESSKGCCETCNYLARTNDGKYQPCKMGHADSGPDKEICADSSDPRYRPHARAWYKR